MDPSRPIGLVNINFREGRVGHGLGVEGSVWGSAGQGNSECLGHTIDLRSEQLSSCHEEPEALAGRDPKCGMGGAPSELTAHSLYMETCADTC